MKDGADWIIYDLSTVLYIYMQVDLDHRARETHTHHLSQAPSAGKFVVSHANPHAIVGRIAESTVFDKCEKARGHVLHLVQEPTRRSQGPRAN